MKEINFFENSQDNLHCLQACIKSVLSFYFPDKVFSDKEIDRHTIHNGGWSWLPPSVVWLQEIGLDVVLFSQFDYKRFAEQGEGFYKEFKGELAYQHEVQNGSVKNLKEIQKASQQTVDINLWQKKELSQQELKKTLQNKNTFAVLKTVHEWLDGNFIVGTSHYVLAIEEYSGKKWKVHDPGLQGIANRKIRKEINGRNIFGDVLLIKGLL